MSGFYGGIDLHAKSNQACIIDDKGIAVKEKKIDNDLDQVFSFFEPYGSNIKIALESTINWYWLVDGLTGAGFDVSLAHPYGLRLITGAKVKTDRKDAFKLANLLRMDALPKAYIYPQDTRPLRDLLRRRANLVIERTRCYVSLRMQFMQYNVNTMHLSALKRMDEDALNMLPIPKTVKMHGALTLKRVKLLNQQIERIEKYLETITVKDSHFNLLTDIPGIARVYGLTIYYEVGDISRFESARHFSSYCRLVPGVHQSSEKTKRGPGSKQGNPYLKNAFSQAAMFAARYDNDIRAHRDRRANRMAGPNKNIKANAILAHKLGMAVFHILKDGVPFRKELLFS